MQPKSKPRRRRATLAVVALVVTAGAVAAAVDEPDTAFSSMRVPVANTDAPAGTYTLQLDHFEVLRTRSRVADTDVAVLALNVDGHSYGSRTVNVRDLYGDDQRAGGRYQTKLAFTGIPIRPASKVVFTYEVVNAGHRTSMVEQALKQAADSAAQQLFMRGLQHVLVSPITGVIELAAAGAIVAVKEFGLNALFANCDGWVAGTAVETTGENIARRTANGRVMGEIRTFPGIDSAGGCGRNSIYKVAWSIRRVNPIRIPRPLAPRGHGGAPGTDICRQGFVWREASPADHVCVLPQVRSQAASDNALAAARRNPAGGPYGSDTCINGYVWREAFPGDHVCVTPQVRAQTASDNAQAAARRA